METDAEASHRAHHAGVWALEKRLWLEGGAVYRELVDPEAVFALPGAGLMSGTQATEAMAAPQTPRWHSVAMTQCTSCGTGQEPVVLGYRAFGERADGSRYEAWCTSTYRDAGDGWRLIQHQQTPTS